MSRTLVIAEPGGTAEGDFDKMCELIRVAAECGASVWKPQWVSSAEAHLQRRTARLTDGERAMFRQKYERAYRWLQWPLEWHTAFRHKCHKAGLQYACSVALPQDVAIIEPFVDYLKISSFEALDPAMHEAVDAVNAEHKTIVSYGMGQEGYFGNDRLHCISAYPAPIYELNLWRVKDLGGYSDHSRHLLAGALAVALGAYTVEAHYRLDSCDPRNPDYAVAFSPAEFKQYIQNIRDAQMMLQGSGEAVLQNCEIDMLRYIVGGDAAV